MARERAWIRNDLCEVIESPAGLFRTHAQNDATVVWAVAGTTLSSVVTLVFTAVTLFLFVKGRALALVTAVPAAAAIGMLVVFARELFVRLRRMGRFVLDANGRMLNRPQGTVLGRIVALRPTTRFAIAFPQVALSWWIVAELEGGPSFRIARGAWTDVRAWLFRLRELDLPVAAIDDDVVLKSFSATITRVAPHRFEFRCPETMAKIVAPSIVAFWIAFASMFVVGPVVTRAPPETWLFMSPLFLFFAVGIVIGILNTFHFYRRSGTFVVDTSERHLYRNGELVAGRHDVSRFVTGNPSQRGVSSARKGLGRAFGPQVLAVELHDGRTFNLFRGGPGDVRFATELLRAEGVPVTDL